MILYKQNAAEGKIVRPSRTMTINIDEPPKRSVPKYNTPRDREKYIKTIEQVVRKSAPYKEYIQFLKENMDMTKCTILRNVRSTAGKRYRIEIHHEPFTLFDIVETVINRRLELGEPITVLPVADEVMGLHYDGKVGLVPLTVTMHELVHSGRIFIPLQYIYQDYAGFYKEYEHSLNQNTTDKLEAKVNLSMHTEDIVSDALDIEFVYTEVQGFKFPEIPDEWKDVLMHNNGASVEDNVGQGIDA